MYTESAFRREDLEGSGGRKEAKEGMKGVEFLLDICERDVILSVAAHSEDLFSANWAFGHSSRERVNCLVNTFEMKMNQTCSVCFSKHFEVPNISSIRDPVLPGMERRLMYHLTRLRLNFVQCGLCYVSNEWRTIVC